MIVWWNDQFTALCTVIELTFHKVRLLLTRRRKTAYVIIYQFNFIVIERPSPFLLHTLLGIFPEHPLYNNNNIAFPNFTQSNKFFVVCFYTFLLLLLIYACLLFVAFLWRQQGWHFTCSLSQIMNLSLSLSLSLSLFLCSCSPLSFYMCVEIILSVFLYAGVYSLIVIFFN